jgi:hypothetical protein
MPPTSYLSSRLTLTRQAVYNICNLEADNTSSVVATTAHTM